MRLTLLAAAAAAALALPQAGRAGTLQDVRAHGAMVCGVHIEKAGFATADASGRISGFDVDFCRAIAAAIGVPAKLSPLSPSQRFTALTSGSVDLLLMTVTENMQRSTKLHTDFPFINYYGGGMLMVKKSLGVTSTKQLDGASICMSGGTTADQFIADYFRANKMTYKQVLFDKLADGFRAFTEGRCDVFTQDDTALATMRAGLPNPADYVILPEVLSKEPVGAVVRQNDSEWANVAHWVFAALVNAEELGITKANVEELARTSQDPTIRRVLGVTGTLGPDAGLPQDWALRAIREGGNYGEIFDRNLGAGSPFKMARGLNALWNKGGLIYGLPLE
jgi:general L-amino acid transport system substrate-binding protein